MTTREELAEVWGLVKQRAFWKLLGICVVVVGTTVEVLRPGVLTVVDWVVTTKHDFENADKLNAQQLADEVKERRQRDDTVTTSIARLNEQLVHLWLEHVRLVAAGRRYSQQAMSATLSDYTELVKKWPCDPRLEDGCFTPEMAANKALAQRRTF